MIKGSCDRVAGLGESPREAIPLQSAEPAHRSFPRTFPGANQGPCWWEGWRLFLHCYRCGRGGTLDWSGCHCSASFCDACDSKGSSILVAQEYCHTGRHRKHTGVAAFQRHNRNIFCGAKRYRARATLILLHLGRATQRNRITHQDSGGVCRTANWPCSDRRRSLINTCDCKRQTRLIGWNCHGGRHGNNAWGAASQWDSGIRQRGCTQRDGTGGSLTLDQSVRAGDMQGRRLHLLHSAVDEP